MGELVLALRKKVGWTKGWGLELALGGEVRKL